MQRQREPIGRIRYLTKEEENRLFHYVRILNEDEWRLAVFLIDTGARVGEALGLEYGDINRRNRTVTFWETKNNSSRTVPLTQRAFDVLLQDISTGEKPFGMINRWTFRDHWYKARELAGLGNDKNIVPHILRHTCCSRLAIEGTDFRRIQMWMGHKSPSVTQRYAHLAPQYLNECARVLDGFDDSEAA
ncbi:site-specific integrase [uncultured Cohaesibacter sp.]|uniref:site-specific integrase n=1 Tax=uncultured Cohaesibacter sp. TaxID=1002546 RepID=UPI0029C77EEF|nr:site-specific integrase [uncultured Cohaesibacter sp.]